MALINRIPGFENVPAPIIDHETVMAEREAVMAGREAKPVDLMKALRQSLEDAKAAREARDND